MILPTFESYNKFIDSERETLMSHRHPVEAHFLRQYGTYDGVIASDAYNTRLGNVMSSPVVDVDRCEQAGGFARLAATASDEDLLTLADTISHNSLVADCPDAAPLRARPAGMVIEVWKKPEPAVVPTVATQPAAITLAALPPAAPQDLRPAALTVVPGGPSAAPTANTDAVAALKAAALALVQAVAALQTAPAANPGLAVGVPD